MGHHAIPEKAHFRDPVVMLYAPLRTLIYIDSADRTRLAVDQPSTVYASFADPVIPELGRDLDRHLADLLDARRRGRPLDASARRQTADFEQFEPERLDLGEHAVERGLVGQHTSQHGLVAVRTGLQDRERGAHRLAQAAADTDLVALGLRILARAAGLLTAHRRTRRMFRE